MGNKPFYLYCTKSTKSPMQMTPLLCRHKSSRYCRVNEQYFKFCSYRPVYKNNFLAEINTIYIFFLIGK